MILLNVLKCRTGPKCKELPGPKYEEYQKLQTTALIGTEVQGLKIQARLFSLLPPRQSTTKRQRTPRVEKQIPPLGESSLEFIDICYLPQKLSSGAREGGEGCTVCPGLMR